MPKLGSRKTVDGKVFECTGHYPSGKAKWSQLDSKYIPGEVVQVVNLMPGRKFDGVIVKVCPLLAKITTQDPVWHGCEITSESNLRKVKSCSQ